MRSQAKVALRFRLSKGWAWILVLQTMTIAFSLRVPVAVAFALTVSCLPLVVDGREAEQHASIIASTNSPFSVPQARFCLLKASLRGTDDDYDTKLTLVTERLYVLAPSNQGSEIQLYKPVKGALVLEKKVPSSLSPKLKLLIGEN